MSKPKRLAIVKGIRTPMGKAGGVLKRLSAAHLASTLMSEIMSTTPSEIIGAIDEVILGNVANPARAMNIARVAALNAGINKSIPAVSVHRNCASGMEAISGALLRVRAGDGKKYLVGGTESMSDIPLLFNDQMKSFFEGLMKARTISQKLMVMSTFRPAFLKPEIGIVLGLTDPTCNLIMGLTAENLAKDFGISRREQDEFACRSHNLAERATKSGVFADEILPICADMKTGLMVSEDEGIRNGQTVEALGKLKPFFDKPHGTVTVGNSSQITDGACMLLTMDEDEARLCGMEVLGYVREFAYSGCEPSRMGIGPVFAINKVLKKAGMSMRDIDIFEINEAFSAQVLACMKAFESGKFCSENSMSIEGGIDIDKLNIHGGGVALGHPVGMTGARLILHILKTMKRENLSTGIASLCVGGGQGAAFILERE